MLRTGLAILLITGCAAVAQIRIPEGTPVRVRIMSEVVAGGMVECVVAEEVRALGRVVIPVGAPVKAAASKSADVTMEAVQIGGKWSALRYRQAGGGPKEIIGIQEAGLKRADQAGETVGKGATYVLYLDQSVATAVDVPAPVKQSFLGWLSGDPEAGHTWMQRYSNWLCVGGLLMLLFGIAYHCMEDWDYWSRKLVRTRASSH